ARGFSFGPDDAAFRVVVDEAHRLHEGIHRGWADELPASFSEFLREVDRCRGDGGSLRLRQFCRAGFVAPKKGGERTLTFYQSYGLPGIVDDRFDFSAMANDVLVVQKPLHIALGETRDFV